MIVASALAACSFDSLADTGGASLGDEDTGTGDDTTPSTSSASASGSGPGSASTSTTDPTTDMSASDPTSESETTPNTESESESDTRPTTASESESESATTRSEGSTTDPTTGDPTTGGNDEPYGACPNGDDDCTERQDCRTYYDQGQPAATVCVEEGCTDAGDCPIPSSGTADPVCVGFDPQFCTLDCEADTSGCPTGMDCAYVEDFQVYRCVWAV
jgi:hypothetical protein